MHVVYDTAEILSKPDPLKPLSRDEGFVLPFNPKAAFVVGSPKGDLGHLGDLLPQIGLLKVTFLFKSLLSERKDDGSVLHTLFAMHRLGYIIYDMIPYLFNNH